MSQPNVESMRGLLESYVHGDYGPAIEALDADVELWLDPQTFPESGPFRGREAVVTRLAEVVSSFDDYWASTEGAELIDAGDWVVMVNRTGGRGRASGAPVEQLWTVAYQLRDAKIVRIEYHPDKEEALKAIGAAELSEQGSGEN
jgi:ketosteroid isomerase-like protein